LPTAHLFVTQHGRDQLHANWPDLYKPEEEATQPAEELLLLRQGGDYGWPECYAKPKRDLEPVTDRFVLREWSLVIEDDRAAQTQYCSLAR
jgi:glucose/arabinose dehydrogenase